MGPMDTGRAGPALPCPLPGPVLKVAVNVFPRSSWRVLGPKCREPVQGFPSFKGVAVPQTPVSWSCCAAPPQRALAHSPCLEEERFPLGQWSH